jgi:hypothetical protein
MRGSPRYERIIRCQNRQSNFTSASAAASLALQDCGPDREPAIYFGGFCCWSCGRTPALLSGILSLP